MAAAVAAGAVALLAVLALVLTDSKPRQSGSNYVAELEPVAQVEGDGRRCQRGVTLPADTSSVRLLLGTYGRPTPTVVVRATDRGRTITQGTLRGGGREGHVTVPVAPVDAQTRARRVCVEVRGSGPTVLYGSSGTVRLEFLRPGSETWLDILPVVARRFGYGKANPFGSALVFVAGLLLLLAWVAAGRLLIRELRA
ncbi:MAG: hypothetical protein JW895_05580 [Thermoleophilaceae bacterium]|nr:hypothetical protein [Thermoleophilaceae bacterium]